MDFVMNHMWCMWLFVAVAFVVLELLTTALVSIWFVPGAVVTAVMSLFVNNFTAQFIVFLALSLVVMYVCKKVFRRTKAEQFTNANELLIGKTAVVKEMLIGNEVKVLVGDVYWRALADESLAQDDLVTVTAVNGNMLTVEKQKTVAKET